MTWLTQYRVDTKLANMLTRLLIVAISAGTDVIIDLNFKDHFKLPHSVPWYDTLLAAVPQDWIGTHAALLVVAKLLAAGMRLVFRQLNTPLPPWREPHAVLSKWLPESFQDEAVPLQPLPDQTLGIARMLAPYHRPFRAALANIWSSPAGPLGTGEEAYVGAPMEAGVSQQQSAAGAFGGGGMAAGKGPGCWGGCLPCVSSVGNGPGFLSDVPKRIIVGFPDQLVAPAPSSKGAAQDGSKHSSTCSYEEGAEVQQLQQEGSVGGSSTTTPRQQLNWRRLQYNEPKEAPATTAAAAVVGSGVGGGAATSHSSSTLSSSYKMKGVVLTAGEGSAHSSTGKVVNLVAVAATGAAEAHQALQFLRNVSPGAFQPQDETVRGGYKPAMATKQLREAEKVAAFGTAKAWLAQAAGVAADGAGVVAGQAADGAGADGQPAGAEGAAAKLQAAAVAARGVPLATWVRQHLTQRPPAVAAAAAAVVGVSDAEACDGGEATAVAAATAATAAAGGRAVGAADAAAAASAAAAAVAAAAATAAGGAVRPEYKSLEQLLPKMRTVKLGMRGGI
jgi:hypothetical protein